MLAVETVTNKGGINYKSVQASPTKFFGSPLSAAAKIKVFSLKFMRKHSMMMMYLGTQQLEGAIQGAG